MIKKIKETLSQVFFSPEASGTWGVECAIDEEVVDCKEFEEDGLDYEDQYYTGVPAPDYLPEDPWFSSPILSEKQMEYKEAYDAAVADQQIADEVSGQEPSDIHQKMYEIATASNGTAIQRDPIGGSENFQGGDNGYGWMSGTGMNQFK
tara:strand:+ start:2243 stop:2689 length:447 start_codon:yes stop_codon:yes gene_type:complete